MTSPRWLGLGLAVLLVVGLASCTEVPEKLDTTAPSASATLSGGPTKAPIPTKSPTPNPKPTPKPSPTSTPKPQPGKAETLARQRLARLVVQKRPVGTLGYSRDAFGSSWKDIDGNGCNQRDDVLLRDVRPTTATVQQQGRCDHDVLAGTWVDPYSGRTRVLTDLKDLSQAQAIQIDHIVPLAEAWVSGANAWTDERREVYANTLSVLLAVDGPTNASKGASDPAAWRPRKGYQCRYAIRWIDIKSTWKLAVDPSEVRALREMLGYC